MADAGFPDELMHHVSALFHQPDCATQYIISMKRASIMIAYFGFYVDLICSLETLFYQVQSYNYVLFIIIYSVWGEPHGIHIPAIPSNILQAKLSHHRR